ncbi:MAG TPA: RecQ family ATP-dependent DNA helicase [Chloroflexota bacterium]|nr:RecQ family ATP-dependent DNA helicase [Chloroflexota bacterium]
MSSTAPEAAAQRLAVLKRYWGFARFRPLQRQAIDAALGGRDVLLVLPTGGGKSLCYQLPPLCGAGMALVISPLIALMQDQVAAASRLGIAAAALHSHVSDEERQRVRQEAASGRLQLLYVSPERAVVGDLAGRLGAALGLIAVDEAHCVSQWGHDFRPEYRQLRPVLDQAPHAARMAVTATATPRVQQDIATQLGLRQALRLTGHVDRPNLVYRALPRHDMTAQVLQVVRRHAGEGGIVYAQTRREVEQLDAYLRAHGIRGAAYHAGLAPAERQRAQEAFLQEQLDVIVATIAFGMGIDRSNVRYVVHANSPRSLEHYQQESGRAGRDGLPAECVLLYSGADLVTHRFLASRDGALAPERQRVLEAQLRDMGRFAATPVCRHKQLTEHFGQMYPSAAAPGVTADEAPEGEADGAPLQVDGTQDGTVERVGPLPEGTAAAACGACDVCLNETHELPEQEALITAQKIISAVWRLGGRFGSGHVVKVLLGQTTEASTRHQHERLSVFGLLASAGERALRSWIDQLVVQGFLDLVEEHPYTLLVMTPAGRQLCQEKSNQQRQVRLGIQEQPARGRGGGARQAVLELRHRDRDLFEELRQLRRALAAAEGVPPYVVFSDATLLELSTERPAGALDMLRIKGVGEAKLARYGAAFLAAIREHQAGAASLS